MDILPLDPTNWSHVAGAAALLVEAFPHSWPTPGDGLEEIECCLEPSRIALVAWEEGRVVGFVGAIPQYGVTGWELHPLVVAEGFRGRGVGTRLVRELERRVAEAGGLTLYAGSDDEFGRTSLSGCDLFDRTWERIRDIQNPGGHPYEFYLKLGYAIVGVIPDANGWGKPDIWLARRIAGSPPEGAPA